MNAKSALLALMTACVCIPVLAETLNVEGLPIQLGNNVEAIQKALETTIAPVQFGGPNPVQKTAIHLKDRGIWVFFTPSGESQTIRLDAPFAGNIGGVRIGSSRASILKSLGTPVIDLKNVPVLGNGPTPIEYDVDPRTLVRFDFNANDEVATMYLMGGNRITAVTNTLKAPPRAFPAQAPDAAGNLLQLQNSAIWQTYLAVNRELGAQFRLDADIKGTLARIGSFEFSAETRQKLREVTGNDHPLHIVSTKRRDGGRALAIAMDALHFKDSNSSASGYVSELSGHVTFDQSLRKAHTVAALPVFHFETGNATQFTASDLNIVADQTRGPFGMWVGTTEVKLGQFTMADSAWKLHMICDDLRAKSEIKPRGQFVDMMYDGTIKSMNFGGDEFSHAHFASRLLNVDAKDFAALQEKSKAMQQLKPNSEERLLQSKSLLKDVGRLMQHGAVYEIEDLSVSYHGVTGGLDGRIALDHAQESDFDSFAAVMKKLDLRINIHIPRSWVDDLSRTFAGKTPPQQNQAALPAGAAGAPANASVANMVSKQLDELEKKKWIRIEQGFIVSSIEFKGGKLLFNGQPGSLPTSPAAPSAMLPSQAPMQPSSAQIGMPRPGTGISSVVASPQAPPPSSAQTSAPRPGNRILAPGEAVTLAAGQTVNFPAHTTISMPNGTNLTIDGNRNSVDALPGSRVTVAPTATGPADNVAIVANHAESK